MGRAAQAVATDWESERPVPPAVIWGRTLDDARVLAGRALIYGDDALPGARAYGEVPFGGSEPKTNADVPWDVSLPVTIPDTGFNIAGYIDRLDISGDGSNNDGGLVTDLRHDALKERIVINGLPITGVRAMEEYAERIDAELASVASVTIR